MDSKEILKEIQKVTEKILSEQSQEFISLVKNAQRIYIVGQGRSGLVAKAFAMRLVHLGKSCFVVGETITPALKKGDVLLAVSGSGKTIAVLETAKTARRLGGTVIVVTASKKSPLAKLGHHLVFIPAKITRTRETRYELRELKEIPLSPPLGSLFEVSALVFFESCVLELMRRLQVDEQKMKRIHANL